MAIDVGTLSLDELLALIENHRRKNATGVPLYLDALAELGRRRGHGLDFDKSFAVLRQAAIEGRFISYKSLSDASGANWARVHYSIGPHLEELVEYAHRKGWPLLSAIVVKQEDVSTGEMDESNLRGFINIARQLGYSIVDERAFVREQQARVFAWGSEQK